MRVCKIKNCNKRHEGLGLCRFHYQRFRSGIPLNAKPFNKKSIEERFWRYVKKTKTCWLWSGCKNNGGYGIIGTSVRNKLIIASRLSWKIHNGEIPKGTWVLHKCDNPPCVNPKHLFIGDNKINCMDLKQKRLNLFGERHPSAKLTDKKVKEIRNLFGKITGRKIAEIYGVIPSNISNIKCGRSWKHLII